MGAQFQLYLVSLLFSPRFDVILGATVKLVVYVCVCVRLTVCMCVSLWVFWG